MTEWLPAVAKRDLRCSFCSEPIRRGDMFAFDIEAQRNSHTRCLSGNEVSALSVQLGITHRDDDPWRPAKGRGADGLERIADSLEQLVELMKPVSAVMQYLTEEEPPMPAPTAGTYEMDEEELARRLFEALGRTDRNATVDPKSGRAAKAAVDLVDRWDEEA